MIPTLTQGRNHFTWELTRDMESLNMMRHTASYMQTSFCVAFKYNFQLAGNPAMEDKSDDDSNWADAG